MLSASRFPCGWHVHQLGPQPLGLQHYNPSQYNHGRHICSLLMFCWACQKCTKQLLLMLHQVGGSFMLLIQLSLSHFINKVGCTTLGAQQSHSIPPPSPHGREGSSSQVLLHSLTWLTESVVGIKPGDYGVVIRYHQVDEFTYTWTSECFIAWSHIYPGFMGKVSILTYFQLEPGHEDYFIWTRQLKTLSMVLILSSCTPLMCYNCMHPLMSLMLCRL